MPQIIPQQFANLNLNSPPLIIPSRAAVAQQRAAVKVILCAILTPPNTNQDESTFTWSRGWNPLHLSFTFYPLKRQLPFYVYFSYFYTQMFNTKSNQSVNLPSIFENIEFTCRKMVMVLSYTVNVTSWIWKGEGDILIVWYSVFHNSSKYFRSVNY